VDGCDIAIASSYVQPHSIVGWPGQEGKSKVNVMMEYITSRRRDGFAFKPGARTGNFPLR